MELTDEEVYFVKIAKVILDIVPKYLRRCFIQQWNNKHPNHIWQCGNSSGEFLFNTLPEAVKKNKCKETEVMKLKGGNDHEWDTSTLIFVMLYSGLKLIPGCRPKNQRTLPLEISEEIDIIREIRNDYFAHVSSMSCPRHQFIQIITDIKSVAANIFSENAEKEINEIKDSHIYLKMTDFQNQQLRMEKFRNEELENLLKERKDDINKVNHDIKELKDNFQEVKDGLKEAKDEFKEVKYGFYEVKDDVKEVKGISMEMRENFREVKGLIQNMVTNQPTRSEGATVIHAESGSTVVAGNVETLVTPPIHPNTQDHVDLIEWKGIDKLKASYKINLSKHEIHTVDINGRIILMEVDINQFAVKLKIRHDAKSSPTFRGETRRYFQHLKYTEGDDIDISQLIDDNNRVTFIRGIAGMGKSILAKQLAYGWATDSMYFQFKYCIIIECREINYFAATNDEMYFKHEIFMEAVKRKVTYNLGDGERVLFVIDGLDELFDINTDKSIILPLLNGMIYFKSKIIITGRPHVEEMLLNHQKNMGGWRKVEIQGLSEEEIVKYVKKFSSREKDIVNINKAKDTSKRYLPVIHVPQFLNTFCCVAILSGGTAIRSTAELYCWTLYLLLKQHAKKQESSEKSISQIFKESSEVLLALSKICHKLLNENRIILEGNIELFLDVEGEDKEFLEGLFVTVSDNYGSRYQFKHLTLMEFLSALYICSTDNRMELIKDHLQNGFIETVVFTCQLIAGFSYEGIIKAMLLNTAKLEDFDRKSYLPDTLKLLSQCNLGKWTTFGRSLDIIMSFMIKDATNIQLVMTSIESIQMESLFSYIEISRRLYEITKLLTHEYESTDDTIRALFHNYTFELFEVNDLETLTCLRYLENVYKVSMKDIEATLRAVHKGIKEIGYGEYERIEIKNCKFQDEAAFESPSDSRLVIKLLTISKCYFNTNSFMILCDFGISSERIDLLELDIDDDWWKQVIEAIKKEKKHRGKLKSNDFQIYKCVPIISEEIQMRIEKIMKCCRELYINGCKVVTAIPTNNSLSGHTSESCEAASQPLPAIYAHNEDWLVIDCCNEDAEQVSFSTYQSKGTQGEH